MSHRHVEYPNYPPRFHFQQQDGPPRTPVARRQPYSMDMSCHLSKTLKLNQITPSQYEFLYQNPPATQYKRNNNQDYIKLTKDLNHIKGEIDAIRIDARKINQPSMDRKWTPKKHEDFLNKTHCQSTTFVSKKTISEESSLRIQLDLRKQLEIANKKINQLQQKNNVLQCLIQSNDSQISKVMDSQISNPFSQSFSQSDKLLQSVKMLQFQRDQAEGKRKNMEQILLIQDQKMKDKECLIKILSQKVDCSNKQLQQYGRQLTSHRKKLEQLQKAPKKIINHLQNSGVQDILLKKDKEITLLKTEITLAKDLIAKKDQSSKDKESNVVTKLNHEIKRIKDELMIKEKELTKQKQINGRIKNNQDLLLKKMKDEALQQVSSMQKQIITQKQNLLNEQKNNENIIKNLRQNIIQLNAQISKKDELFSKNKDQIMHQLISHESTIRNLQYDIQKFTTKEKTLQDTNTKLSLTVNEQQIIIRKLKDSQQQKKDWIQRQSTLMKDKETYQRLLISQQGEITILKNDIQNLKQEIVDLKQKVGRQAGLLFEKQSLNNSIKQKEGSINNLKSEMIMLQKQIGLQKQLQTQKQLHLKMLLTQQGTIKDLRQQNSNLLKTCERQKNLRIEKQNLEKLLKLKDDQIKSIRQNINALTLQASKSRGLQLEKDGFSKLLKNQENDLSKLRFQVQNLTKQCGRQKNLIDERQSHQKLIQNQNSIINSLKQEINKLNSQISKNKNIQSEKEYWMKLAVDRQAQIRILKDQIIEASATAHREKQLLQQNDKLQKLIMYQQSSMKDLREQNMKNNVQISRNKGVQKQKQAWMNIASEREIECKRLREENKDLAVKAIKEKQLQQQKVGYQKILLTRDASIKCLKQQTANLQTQVGKQKQLQQQKDDYQKLINQLRVTIDNLKQQLNMKVSNSNDSIKNLYTDIQNSHVLIKDFQLQNERLKSQLLKVNQAYLDLQSSKQLSDSLYTKLLKQFQQKSKQLHIHHNKNKQMSGQIALLSKDSIQKQSKLSELQVQLIQMNKEITDLKEKLQKTHRSSKKQSNHANNVIKGQSTVLKVHQPNSLNSSNSSHSANEQTLRQEIKQQGQTISTLQSVIRSMEHEVTIAHQTSQKFKQWQEMLDDSNNLLIKQGLILINKRLADTLVL